MRRSGWIVTGALVAGMMGCAHGQAETASAPSGYEQARNDFERAYDSIKSGASRTADAGRYALRGVGNGVVEVTDRSKEAIARSGSKADDAWITTKVKGELATTKGVRSGDVHVDTDDGVVRLGGTVDTGWAARRAIRVALDTKGVQSVESDLKYPQ
ncbi:MAG TPA: BON domain-containing protein [Polyangia bacterium]|jgi:hyperosmotically inducible protein